MSDPIEKLHTELVNSVAQELYVQVNAGGCGVAGSSLPSFFLRRFCANLEIPKHNGVAAFKSAT
jgi:hypothetical protein